MKPKINFFAATLLLISAGGALAELHYVDVNGTNATPPYTNWSTAATIIQDAVDAAVPGDEVVVTNGVYRGIGNDFVVEVDKLLSIRSVNGPQATIIFADFEQGCAYLLSSASLSGFTLTGGDSPVEGGGARGGTLNNCVLSSNTCYYGRGGSGGGAYLCTLNSCTLSGNWAAAGFGGVGGGAANCTLRNCTLIGNSAQYGGGASDCTLINCTLAGNSAQYGGGASACGLVNCIVYYNTNGGNHAGSALTSCCTTPDPGGIGYTGNITNAPMFMNTNGWTNLRLQSNSPCINAGNNSYATSATDLDGNPRIAGGSVDIGAYEFQAPVSMISYAWLQQFNLPINPATDTADPDGDGVDNYHEWLAVTDPNNPLSTPAQLTIIPSGTNVILTWPTNAIGFTLQSTTNLYSPAVWTTNSPAPFVIGGQNVVTNLLFGVHQFYRLSQ